MPAPIRFSDYAVGKFKSLPSRKSVKKAIKSGQLRIDDKEAHTGVWMQQGMKITLIERKVDKKVFDLEVPVVFEDDYLAIVNKPAGISTSGNTFHTLENALPYNLTVSPHPDAYACPKPVHRLDRATSGLVLIAKTKSIRVVLGDMLEKRVVKKTYLAIVKGKPKIGKGKIETPIENKPAFTAYKTLKANDKYALLELSPATGRTHQLRIHCAESGFPIIGDTLYGDKKAGPGKGLFLCATTLAFSHPVSEEHIVVTIDLPKKFYRLVR